jgi:hypothetical protein
VLTVTQVLTRRRRAQRWPHRKIASIDRVIPTLPAPNLTPPPPSPNFPPTARPTVCPLLRDIMQPPSAPFPFPSASPYRADGPNAPPLPTRHMTFRHSPL